MAAEGGHHRSGGVRGGPCLHSLGRDLVAGGPGRLDRSRSRRGNRHGLRRERRAITLSGAASCGRRCLRQRARGRLELDGHSRLRIALSRGVEWVIGRGKRLEGRVPCGSPGAGGRCLLCGAGDRGLRDRQLLLLRRRHPGRCVRRGELGRCVRRVDLGCEAGRRPGPRSRCRGRLGLGSSLRLGDGPYLGLRNRFRGGLRDGGGVGFGGRRVLGNRLVLRSSGVLGSRGVLGDVRPARCCSIVGCSSLAHRGKGCAGTRRRP